MSPASRVFRDPCDAGMQKVLSLFKPTLRHFFSVASALEPLRGANRFLIRHGTYSRDAENNANNAQHLVYNENGPDVKITISEAVLGGFHFGFWGSVQNLLLGRSNDFSFSLADLYEELDK